MSNFIEAIISMANVANGKIGGCMGGTSADQTNELRGKYHLKSKTWGTLNLGDSYTIDHSVYKYLIFD